MIKNSTTAYIGPFLVFIAFLALGKYLPVPPDVEQIIRFAVVAAAIWYFSRHLVSLKMVSPLGTIAIGVGVFLLWIGPDALFPGYRTHWLFQNSITGKLESTMPPGLLSNPFQLILRTARAAGGATWRHA